MNKKELELKRRKTWYKYKIPGQSNMHRIKKNAIFISPANSEKHEMAKCRVCYLLKKQGKQFITEAQTCSKDNFRHDIVCLDDGEIWEIETDPRRAARFKGTGINVVKLWLDDPLAEFEGLLW